MKSSDMGLVWRVQNVQKMTQKNVFKVLAKILPIKVCFFTSERKCQWPFDFLQKQHVC